MNEYNYYINKKNNYIKCTKLLNVLKKRIKLMYSILFNTVTKFQDIF